MELRHLRTFVAVVECGGFRRAAARLHFSQPAVTQQIQELERSLGLGLFDRLPGRVELTPAGARFVDVAQRLLDTADEAADSVRRPAITGTVRIGVFPGAGAELTHPLLVELRRRLPAVTFEVSTLDFCQWASRSEGVDAMIMRDPVDPVVARRTELFAEPFLAAVPWRWPEREANRLSLAEFLELPLARMSHRVPATFRAFWCLDHLRDGTEASYRGYPGDCPEDLVDAVVGGFGAALGTPSISRAFGDPRMAFLPLAGDLSTRSWFTTPAQDRRPIVDVLHRHVAAIVQQLGPLVLPRGFADGQSASFSAVGR